MTTTMATTAAVTTVATSGRTAVANTTEVWATTALETATEEEIATSAKHDYDAIVRGTAKGTSYGSLVNALSSVDSEYLTRK